MCSFVCCSKKISSVCVFMFSVYNLLCVCVYVCMCFGVSIPLHESLLGAFRADDVLLVGDEAAAYQTGAALGAEEAVVVPMAVLERDKLGATDSSDGLVACEAPLGKQLAEAFSAIRLLVAGGEALAGQALGAVGAGEALPMPGLVLIGDASASDHLVALDATSSELLLVTLGTVYLLFPRNEALGADGILAHATAEALFVPLSGLVLHLLRTCSEDFVAPIAS